MDFTQDADLAAKLSDLLKIAADEEATTEASLVPFNSELAQLDAQLKEKRSQIRHYKAAVVRNDEKIERLLEQVVNVRS